MGAIEDYYNEIEAAAQAQKAKMWAGVENAVIDFENYATGKKADFYGGQPTEEQMRLKRQQIKDQYIQAAQEMRDRENASAYARMQSQMQGPPMPQIPAGWQPTEASSGQVSAETAAALTPEERFAVAQGYTPARAEAVHPVRSGAPQAAPSRPAMQESGPKTYLDVMNLLPTEGDRLEYRRTLIEKDKAAKLNHAIQYVMQAYAPEEQKHALEMYKEQINSAYAGEDLRRMDEKPIFKQATEVFGQRYRDRVEVLSNFRGQLEVARSIKDKGEKVLFLKTNIAKMLNTMAVAAPDAVGVEERKEIMGEFRSIFNTPITQWGDLVENKGWIDAALKQPDEFIEKAQKIYNIAANVNNNKTKHYYNKLGQDALTAAGGVMLNKLEEGDSMASMQAIRTGESRMTPATSYPGETPAVSNQNMSRPLKRGTVSQSGVRLFGPTPNPFLLQGGD